MAAWIVTPSSRALRGREFDAFYIRHGRALSSEGWHPGFRGGALLRSEENFGRGRQWQSFERMPVESQQHVTQEKDTGGAVADSVMRGEDEGAVRLLMEQYSAEERSLIGSKRCVYFFGDL